MPTLNPFDNDAFSMRQLSAAINTLPNKYGRLGELGLFNEAGGGVRTRSIMIEEYQGRLVLLRTKPLGDPGDEAKRGRRNVRSLTIPHIPLKDEILPDEYAGIRAFGTENEFDSLNSVMMRHLQQARDNYEITWEFLRWGALKGVILDADGTVLYNLYNEFDVAQKSIDFDLGNASNVVQTKCFELSRYMEENLMGEVMSGIRALVDPAFFDKLIAHPHVRKTWEGWQASANMLGGDPRKSFTYGGITFEEHSGKASDREGNVRRFIEAGEGHAFPVGTMQTFRTFYAPADFLETTNTLGIPLYAKQKVRDFERGLDMHFQSNPLPLCMRPRLLVRLYSKT